jgi:hypothetical protein
MIRPRSASRMPVLLETSIRCATGVGFARRDIEATTREYDLPMGRTLAAVWVMGVAAAACFALSACGGKTTTTATIKVVRTETKTTTAVVVAAPRSSTPLPALPDPQDCGNGVTSNGDCGFALEEASAFRHSWDESGVPPARLTVMMTPQTCTGYAHDAWLCKTPSADTQGGELVYTAFAYAGPNRPAASALKATTGPSPPPQPLPSPAPSPPTQSNSPSFSGNGGKNIGTINVASDSTIRWTDDGGLFQVLDFGINSQGQSGTSALAAGTYRNVEVNALGNWTLKIVPNS